MVLELKVKVALFDIEGTTTSISFVKDELYSYARNEAETYLTHHWQSDEIKEISRDLQNIDEFQDFSRVTNLPDDIDEKLISQFVVYLINKDLKVKPLKTLQGFMWKEGYKNGALKGHVFPDVPKAFQDTSAAGVKLYIYSSGSVAAQKLLFGSTTHGDLLQYLNGHFDLDVGFKQDEGSYVNILRNLGINGKDAVFFTDIVNEAEAATKAGIRAIILSRPGNASLTDDDKEKYSVISSFDEIKLTSS
ncbi:ENOPH1 family protein [Megaselia abdita]